MYVYMLTMRRREQKTKCNERIMHKKAVTIRILASLFVLHAKSVKKGNAKNFLCQNEISYG